MQAILPLGNDLVDLRLAENKNIAANRRFVERVLAPRERIAPSQATIDHSVFWAFWAAKEAAYKSLKKTNPGLIFSHRRFVVRPETPLAPMSEDGRASGVVSHDAGSVPVSWVWNDDWMHCVSGPDSDPSRYRIATTASFIQSDAFIAMKKTSTLNDASIAARLLAMALLEEQGIDDVQIVREPLGRRQGPPKVLQHDSEMTNVDISLSHHGDYVAAAIQIREK